MDTTDQPLGKPEGTARSIAALACLIIWALYYGISGLIHGAPVQPPCAIWDEVLLGIAGTYFGLRTAWTAKRVVGSLFTKSSNPGLQREDEIEKMATALGVALRRASRSEPLPVTPVATTPAAEPRKAS